MLYFYDTCALLNLQEKIFEYGRPVFSPVTLREIEDIKTSGRKDEETKFRARNAARMLKEHCGDYYVWSVHERATLDECSNANVPNDLLILNDYLDCSTHSDIVFVTDDINLFNMAIATMPDHVVDSSAFMEDVEEYTGYVHFEGSDEELAQFYENLCENSMNVLTNQYVFVNDIGGGKMGYRWTGTEYELLYTKPVHTKQFGNDFKARDIYQRAAIDSIMNNSITAITGPAGSGKSLLSLVCAFDLIERDIYDRLIMLINPAKVYGACDMGFYPGSVHDKITESFAGHMLSTKLGDRCEIDRLVDSGKLQLVSMADMRGMEIREREILYITECQNTSIELLKLCLSRVTEGAKVIIEGDYKSQVDHRAFMNGKNGMKRAIEVLKGSSIFGYVQLKRIWRSELAELVSQM